MGLVSHEYEIVGYILFRDGPFTDRECLEALLKHQFGPSWYWQKKNRTVGVSSKTKNKKLALERDLEKNLAVILGTK